MGVRHAVRERPLLRPSPPSRLAQRVVLVEERAERGQVAALNRRLAPLDEGDVAGEQRCKPRWVSLLHMGVVVVVCGGCEGVRCVGARGRRAATLPHRRTHLLRPHVANDGGRARGDARRRIHNADGGAELLLYEDGGAVGALEAQESTKGRGGVVNARGRPVVALLALESGRIDLWETAGLSPSGQTGATASRLTSSSVSRSCLAMPMARASDTTCAADAPMPLTAVKSPPNVIRTPSTAGSILK